jgi:hypothetical protein
LTAFRRQFDPSGRTARDAQSATVNGELLTVNALLLDHTIRTFSERFPPARAVRSVPCPVGILHDKSRDGNDPESPTAHLFTFAIDRVIWKGTGNEEEASMRVFRVLVAGICVGVLLAAAAAQRASAQTRRPAAELQQSVTSTDIQRLQDAVYDISGDISRLRSRDVRLGDQLQAQLDDLRDEVIYLKVKLRKEGSLQRTEYWDLRDRLDDLRSRVRDNLNPGGGLVQPPPVRQVPPVQETPAQIPPPTQPTTTDPNEVPVGTELDVRLRNPLSSATAQVEDRFEATTMVDLNNGNRVLIPAGSIVRGVVTSANKAGRLDRKGSLTLSFDQVTIHGRSYPIRATVDQVLESEGIRGEAGKIGAGAGVGAIIGGILGGVKGALAGIIIGGGGTVAATTGKDVELLPGTVLRMRFDTPLVVR